ncbi:hypothetical protein MESS4_560044 [Mesorhizobium sp. STM 4661]|nr:hypothetical protein MESS4_560044 [Mesorhizobium sp. STM 4661]
MRLAAGHRAFVIPERGGAIKSKRRRSFAPPSVLPDISPSRGEIGRHLGFRKSPTLKEVRDNKAANLPP